MVMLDPTITRLALAISVVMLMLGCVTAWTSANLIKRLVGVVVAMLGGLIGLAALGAPQSALMVGGAIAFTQLVIGAALIVRLQEAYGGVEASELDIADDADEPAEPKA